MLGAIEVLRNAQNEACETNFGFHKRPFSQRHLEAIAWRHLEEDNHDSRSAEDGQSTIYHR